MSVRSRVFAVATAAAALAAQGAWAHPHLQASSPAAGAVVVSPARIVLRFNQPLEPKFSGGELTSTTRVAGVTARVDPADAKTLVLVPPGRLPAGGYKVTWHAVGLDTHRVEGGYAFTVR